MDELNREEIKVLEEMEDHRFVSELLEKAFCTGGLSAFRQFIRDENKKIKNKHEKLAVLLRGNDNKLIIYKNNHKIWELSVTRNGCKVSFDFNHARYYKYWSSKLDTLMSEELGFHVAEHRNAEVLQSDKRIQITRNYKGEVTGGSIGTINCVKESFDRNFVENSYNIISALVNSFFKPQNIDYFRDKVSKKYPEVKKVKGIGKNPLIEKRWQQRLLFHFRDMKDGYYAYDLEFSQKYPDSDYVERFAKKHGNKYASVKAKIIKKKLGTNEPDMLAIRYKKGNPEAIVLIEVKSTLSACIGDSGIEKHMMGMSKYAEQQLFMKKRKNDAYKSLCQYKRMGVIKNDVVIKEIPENLRVEKVLILTNAEIPRTEGFEPKESALDYFKANKSVIQKWAKEYGCSVWITKSNYWDEEIVIDTDQDYGDE